MATLFQSSQDCNDYAADNVKITKDYEPISLSMATKKTKLKYSDKEEGELPSSSESEQSFNENLSSKRLKLCETDSSINDGVYNNLVSTQLTNKENKVVEDSIPQNERPKLSQEDFEKLRKELKEKKKRLKYIPRLTLKEAGLNASLCILPEKRIPLFLTDIQHLILYSLLGHHSPYLPSRWCQLEKWNRLSQTVVIVAENITLEDYLNNKSLFENINNFFNGSVEIVTPAVCENSIISELVSIPLTGTQKNKLLKEFGTLEAAMKNSKDVMIMMRAVFPIKKELMPTKIEENLPTGNLFSRTKLLLSPWQMVEEGYPLPLKGELSKRYFDFVMTKDSYGQVNAYSPMFGLDCEMCMTKAGSELTRVSMVNEKYEVVYETFVKPFNKIIDYVTQFSGITKEMLENVSTRIEDVHRDIRRILPADAILVGQSLNSDLNAMKMMHPYVIDTSVIFNITGNRVRKSKLQLLAKEFLGETIQDAATGHDSVEDSSASLKLTQLKLAKGIHFGDAVLENPNKQYMEYKKRDTPISSNDFATSIFNQVSRSNKFGQLLSAQILGCTDVINEYENFLLNDDKKMIKCLSYDTNKDVIKNACHIIKDHKLTITHLKIPKKKIKEKIEKTIKKIDHWNKKVWESMDNNSLCIIVLGGDLNANGACFLGIKKEVS